MVGFVQRVTYSGVRTREGMLCIAENWMAFLKKEREALRKREWEVIAPDLLNDDAPRTDPPATPSPRPLSATRSASP